jgi:hypothetical protein
LGVEPVRGKGPQLVTEDKAPLGQVRFASFEFNGARKASVPFAGGYARNDRL